MEAEVAALLEQAGAAGAAAMAEAERALAEQVGLGPFPGATACLLCLLLLSNCCTRCKA